jgi:hypothetical protein
MRLALHFTDGVAKAVNVLHFQLAETGGITDGNLLSMADFLEKAFINNIWKIQATIHWTVTGYDVLYAHIESQPNVYRTKAADAIAGQSNDTNDYASTAFLINWSTGDPRRGGKPRTYLAGVGQASDADSANISNTYRNNINTGIGNFFTAIAGHAEANLHLTNFIDYSTVNKGAYRLSGVVFPISGGTCNSVIGNQRRRVARVRLG